MRYCFLGLMICACAPSAIAQDHTHGDHDAKTPKIEPPTVFLDKSPRIVQYQLKRLDNQRLLLVERKTNDTKYIPVYAAILSRVGMSPQFREESVEALVKLKESGPATILLEATTELDSQDRDQRRAARQLAGMLLRQKPELLKAQSDVINEATESDSPLIRSIAFAALIVSGQADAAIAKLTGDEQAQLAFLSAIELVPNVNKRSSLRDQVVSILGQSDATPIKREAISALSFIRDGQDATFKLVAPFFADPELRNSAVKTLLKVPAKQRNAETSLQLVSSLVDHAEQTPAEKRTTNAFIDAMQLADQLMAKVPAGAAKGFRSRLDAVVVRVVRIKTVEEEMRYDTSYFAVQAGKSVQIVLENEDLMPHNLVVTVPGALKEVAQLGLQAGPNGGWNGLQYVPESDKVLHATQMVPEHQQATLTFTAPSEPGEYPYVCTFPQHWYRMYGVMVVVEDLDAWLKNPVEPANPIGSNRSFVQTWNVDELKDDLEAGLRGRSPEIGKKIFVEASCAGCHKVNGEGGVIGPELSDVFSRWKGDRVGVLREILDPSHKVDAKYAMQRILTVDGRTITGVLIKEDDDNVTLMSNPEAKEPTVIPQDDIEAMVPSSVSMMPKALMDQYTKDEIFELVAYLESVKPQAN
jgi:putative heme-binding domain-containing protein